MKDNKNFMKLYFVAFAAIVLMFGAQGCSELNEDIAQPANITFHEPGILTKDAPNFHGKLIKANNWKMEDCQQCHGGNYSGGNFATACTTCHSNPSGPESCNTCHGSFGNASIIAPPQDLSGNVSTTLKGIGAHSVHLYENTFGHKVACVNCHNVPGDINDPGHIDNNDNRAEVIFDSLATGASYDPATGTCSNVYCHGNYAFRRADAAPADQFAYAEETIRGNNKTVNWTKVDGTEATCGSCHNIPPKGHINVGNDPRQCFSCHSTTIDQNGVLNPENHINGRKNIHLSKMF